MNITNLDFGKLKALLSQNDANYQSYELAIDSVNRHIKYCEYHYDQCVKLLKDKKLDFLSPDPVNGFSNKLKYEAHAAALMQSLHSLVDSTLYVIYLLHQPPKPEEHDVKLGNKTLTDFEKHSIDTTYLRKMLDDKTCSVLRSYINSFKHKYIFNTPYEFNSKSCMYISAIENKHLSVSSPQQQLDEYLPKTYNHIVFELVLPFYKNLYNP